MLISPSMYATYEKLSDKDMASVIQDPVLGRFLCTTCIISRTKIFYGPNKLRTS